MLSFEVSHMITEFKKACIVKKILDKYRNLTAIYLYGSSIKEETHSESDIDLAILQQNPLDTWELWKVSQEIAQTLKSNVDLIDLRKSSTVMKMQVVSTGICLYEGNRMEKERFEDFVYSSYARLNEERRAILKDIQDRGDIYG